jgi:tRNA threonylcarbamoyladenosine biosynthesis protein TsaE
MIVPSVEAMEALGKSLAIGLQPGDIIALTGGLGAGKTTLARGILRGLGYDEEVPSPSFAIVQAYEPPAVRLPLAHVDLYRLERAEEAAELGLEDWLDEGALVVEWPGLLDPALLRDALHIDLTIGEDGARVLTVTVPGAWEGRWPPK